MTNGTSQGLFVVVAIVIFGIFVALSYTVFGNEGLSGGLEDLYSTALHKANVSISGNPLVVTSEYLGNGEYTITAENTNPELEIDRIELLSRNEGVNLFPNGDFNLDFETAYADYGVRWSRRGTTIPAYIDDTLDINGSNALVMQFPDGGWSRPHDSQADYRVDFTNYFSDGSPFTVSFDAYANMDTEFSLRLGIPTRLSDGTEYQYSVGSVDLTDEVSRYSLSFERGAYQSDSIILLWAEEVGAEVYISNIKVEHGTEGSEYSDFAMDSVFDGLTGNRLSLNTDKLGTYTFRMIDTDGNVYTRNITLK